jgi:hypothetical protein
MAQLSVLIFKYLSLVGLALHDVLEVHLRCLQLAKDRLGDQRGGE